MESSSGDEEAKDEGEEGKKKKPRSGFRDRKVINKQYANLSTGIFDRIFTGTHRGNQLLS